MKQLHFVPVLLLAAGLLAACAPAAAESVRPSLGAATAPLLATSSVVTPASDRAMQDAAQKTAIAGRATNSPFPTAAPSTIQTGQPSLAAARRDGLSLEVRLRTDTYLAGERGRAEVTLRNDGPETLFVQGEFASLSLFDEQGRSTDPWPWLPASFPGRNRRFPAAIVPGQVLTGTADFQVPPGGAGRTYALWGQVTFGRPAPGTPQGPGNLWLSLEVGPVPLQVISPDRAQRLVADLQVDRDGWLLQVTDPEGRVPSGPLWGELEAASPGSILARPLDDRAGAAWWGTWDEHMRATQGEICVRAWVAAPGYAATAMVVTLPGTGDRPCLLAGEKPSYRESYLSLDAAQATLAYPLYRPGHLPAGARLESVVVETRSHEPRGWGDATQTYRLAGDAPAGWLELSQQATAEPYPGFGWGQARHDPEATVVTVGGTAGYAIRRSGQWLLDWKCGDAGLELRAPLDALSLEALVAVAAGVRSPAGTCPPPPTPAPLTPSPAPPPAPTAAAALHGAARG
jgi:hypothetical protein